MSSTPVLIKKHQKSSVITKDTFDRIKNNILYLNAQKDTENTIFSVSFY